MNIFADIGGTKMRVASSADLENLSDPLIMDTHPEYAGGMAALSDAIRSLAKGEKIDHIVADITGIISQDKKVPLTSPHLPDWREKPLAADLEAAFSAPVELVNDTALVGLGEAVFGAGKGEPIVVYMTVSTGVGGVRIVDGKIDRAAWGFEIGGQYLFIDGNARSLEDIISGTAISEKYGKPPKEIEKDSPVWEELSLYMAYGVHNAILHWSPTKVVLGGSMLNEIGIPVDRVETHVKEIMRKVHEVPPIVHSSLKDFGGLWGGMAYLKNR